MLCRCNSGPCVHHKVVRRNSRLACLSGKRQRGQHPSRPPPIIGHEEDRNPLGLGPRDTRSITGVPDHFPDTSPQGVTDHFACAASNGRSSRFKSWCGHHFIFPCEVKEPVGLLSRLSWCESMWGSHFQRSTSGIDEETVLKTAALSKASRVRFSGAPPYSFPLRSSTAEQPADNRQTVERHHAEGPFYAGWLRKMSGGLKTRTGWRATNSSDHFMASSM